jgi:hypothetical protein
MRKNLLLITVWLSALFAGNAYAQTEVTFETLGLPVDSFWNGSDGSGGFTAGKAYFYNSYNSQYGSWTGFAYSSKSDSVTPGFTNMYSSANGKGAMNSATYAVAYISSFGGPTAISLKAEARGKTVAGFYINNNTYAYQSMLNGDSYSKKFTSHDSDWFMLRTYGYFNGNITDSVDFYLADFRFADSTKAYIVKSWQWLDLTSLGNVDSITFKLSSSDVGQWGMNTPAYFCMDNFKTMDGVGIAETGQDYQIRLFPNPVQDRLHLDLDALHDVQIRLYDISGRLLGTYDSADLQNGLDVSNLQNGLYYISVLADGVLISKKFIKN